MNGTSIGKGCLTRMLKLGSTVPIESVPHGLVEFLKLGPDVEVLDPPELRDMLAAAIRDMAKMYGV